MSAQRHDHALRRRRLQIRISALKRRVGVASVVGFGALLGLVAEHAVGAQRHAAVAQPNGAPTAGAQSAAPTSFFDASGPSYSFDDGSAQLPADVGQGSPSSSPPPPPVAQTSVS